MALPTKISVHGGAAPAELEAFVRDCAEALGHQYPEATHCAVALDLARGQPHSGQRYSVRIDVSTPSGAIAVARDPATDRSDQGFQSLIRDAFAAVDRELQDAEPPLTRDT